MTDFASLLDQADALVTARLAALGVTVKGDAPGHPFRGNQWTGGGAHTGLTDSSENDFRHYAADDDAEVNQTLGESHKQWEKGLSKKERESLKAYTTNEYHQMNGALRSGLDPDKPPPTQIKVKIKGVDDAIAKAPGLPENTMLYRGMSEKNLYEQVKAGKVKKGNALVDRGLMSTSPQIKETEVFLDGDHPVLYKIQAAKGAKGAYLGFKSINPANADEAEFLLPRKSKLSVIKASMNGNVAEIELSYGAD